ncbi:MAG: glucoamylase family protein, partial [Gallionella sp.]
DQEGLAASFRTMWFGPLIAVASIIYLSISRPAALVVAGPILGVWFASPLIAWWISRPLSRREARLTADQVLFLRKLSRRTWAFFETFVGPEDHWLPPDNYQEYRVATVAHRTSPTNMGLALLANLSAYDFGYLSAGQLILRTENAFHTMNSLERDRGHFYNWYDTQSLKPLTPKYISSVDSGNLAAHLLTLRMGLLALPDQKILGPQVFGGLSDTLKVLVDAAGETTPALLAQIQKDAESVLNSPPTTLMAARQSLDQLATSAAEVAARFDSVDPAPDSEANWWARAFARQCRDALDDLSFLISSPVSTIDEIPTLRGLARLGNRRASERIEAIERLALQSSEFSRVEYDFLFDKARHLLAIVYNVGERRLDSSYYDLLASEARLCCFVAIAQRQLPQESWFSLGRLLTSVGGEPVLLSWSGSMFEYLMPLLVMPTYEHTLLDQTYKAAVDRQIEYGKQRGVPWGMSESGYNTVDIQFNYQYRAFGVPGLGLKRGLAEDLVIAPYASALALMVAPEEACRNLQRLAAEGFAGKYGFYEAIDYT